MLSRLVVSWLVVAALLSPVAAVAEEGADASALARQMVNLAVAPGMESRIDRMIAQVAEKQPADKQAEVRAELLKASAGIREDLMATFATYYATAYTPAELKDLVAFYRSPLGLKTVQVEEHKPAEVNAAIQQQIMKLVALLNMSAAGK
ncbi:DUF2059 domain-containing protein [Xanthobacter oligotrophicus]|uniref:DUF2059 domain-containing protein n=1 Tax=Xanthobacter oligotrophicus TaxID=2607286 RepID=UPI00165E2F77|nr:DUF2059 domain-containing protein [Xanthobacter oligotrophicus]MCG5236000.1 DUF2059 domain-containing protein [Xanthobacter oligotrophicus]